MNVSNLSDVAQIMEAVLFSLTVMYIAKEARQALNLTKAQYGHSLTQRMYDRYLSSAQNTDFAMFMAKNWDGDDMADHEHWRVTLWMNTLLVDIFDTWDMHDKGLIEKSHLDMFGTLLGRACDMVYEVSGTILESIMDYLGCV